MKLLGYELKKLLGIKYLWVSLILTALICTGLYYYLYIGNVDFSEPYYDREFNAMKYDFFRRCEDEPERIAEMREVYDAYNREADRVREEIKSQMTEDELVGFRVTDEMLAEHGVTYEDQLGYVRADGTPVGDAAFFETYSLRESTASSLLGHIDDIVHLTEGAMERFESVGAEDLPIYEYERHYNEVYSSLRAKLSETMRPAEPRGMENMFSFKEFPIFIYAFLLLASGVVFLNERSVGLLPVVRTTKYGRMKTSAAKLGALMVVAVLTVLCLSAVQLAVTYIKFGLTFGSAPAQYMRRDCPYPLTVNGYFLCVTLERILAAASFSCVVALIASLTVSHIATYISGALIIGVNVAVGYAGSGKGIAALNLIDLGNDTLFSRYDESLLFGHYYGTLALGAIILAGAVAVFGALLVTVGGRGSYVPAPRRVRRLIPAVKAWFGGVGERLARRRRAYPSTLFGWEAERIMTPAAIFAVIALFGLSVYTSAERYTEPIPPSFVEYEKYLDENWAGELTDEKYEEIKAKFEEVSFLSALEARDELMKRYTRGEITFEEYVAFLESIADASDEAALLEAVKSRADHLHTLKAETGVTGHLFADTHISRILGRDVNFFLLIAVIAVFSRMYAPDHAKKSSEGEFAAILWTSKRGRRGVFRARFAAASLGAFVIALMFEGVDLIIGIAYTEGIADVLSAPVSSIEQYRALGPMTVGAYLAVTTLLRTLAYIPLAHLCCALSFAVKKLSPTLFGAAVFAFLPYVLVYMGQRAMRFFDVTSALAGGKLLLRSADAARFGGAYGFALVFLAAYALVAAVAVMLVRRRTGE